MHHTCPGPSLGTSARVVSISKHVVASIWSCEQLNSHPRGALEVPESRGPSEPGVVSETIARDALLRTGAWPGLIENGTVPIWTIDYVYLHLQPPIQSPFFRLAQMTPRSYGKVTPVYSGSSRSSQWPPGCPSSPYGLCALVGSSSADSYELVLSCEHFIHTSTPPSWGLSGGNFPNFWPLVGLPTGSAASGPSARTTWR